MSFMIALDAGHGLSNSKRGVYDPGAVYYDSNYNLTYQEADIAFYYASLLGELLSAEGYGVFQTRQSINADVPLSSRVKAAECAGCDALLSIHLNAFSSDSASGCEVLYRDYEKDASLARLALSGVINAGLKFRSRGIKERSNLAVLKSVKPAALLEIGFITNDSDRSKICDLVKARKICESIVTHFKMFGIEG